MASLFSSCLRTNALPSSSRLPALRAFSSTPLARSTPKVPIALVAELRRQAPVSLSKAREALAASDNTVDRALEWLAKDLEVAGAAKAAKVGSRTANEGLVGVSVMGARAAMVEVRCETDFVSLNEVFRSLVQAVAGTVAFLDPPEPAAAAEEAQDPLVAASVEELLNAPVMSADPGAGVATSSSTPHQTISQAITAAITQTGENIVFSRAISFASPLPIPGSTTSARQPLLVPGAYVHGAASAGGNEGRVGALVLVEVDAQGEAADAQGAIANRVAAHATLGTDIQKLARTLARQAVGFPTVGVSAPGNGTPSEEDASRYLLDQPAMMFGGDERTVRAVLEAWGKERDLAVAVKAVKRWTVGGEE